MNKELLRHIASARPALVAAVILGVLGAVATVAQMTLLSRVVAGVFLGHQGLAGVTAPLAALLAAIVVRAGLVWGQEMAAQGAAIRATSELRARLCAHLLRLGPAYSRGERSGELVTAAVEGVDRLDPYVGRFLPQVALSAGVPLLIAAYVAPLDWMSAVLLAVTGPIIPLLMILVGSYTEAHTRRQWTALSRMGAHFLDAVQGLPTLVAFGRAAAERERVARVSEAFRDRTLRVLRLAFLSGMVLEFMSSVAIALVAVTLGVRLLDGGIAFERAFLVLLLAPEFYRPLRDLGAHHHAGMEGRAAAERIMEIMRAPAPGLAAMHSRPATEVAWQTTATKVAPTPRRRSGMPPLDAQADPARHFSVRGVPCDFSRRLIRRPAFANYPQALAPGHGGPRPASHPLPEPRTPTGPLTIQLEGVTYTYKDSERPALDGVTLTLPAGARTAIVGRSGAGKSTLVNLLLRFADPDGGRIAVDGIPHTALPIEMWRGLIALVPQRPYLFYGSARDNIRLARPDASDEAVAHAAALAGADTFIARLPQGYDTPIGERGARLSAGQAQRIAIARAFLKDAPLLILDEPTSSLDPESEAIVSAALERLMRDRTVLIIAHRLNTIAGAEQIVVLDEGGVVENNSNHSSHARPPETSGRMQYAPTKGKQAVADGARGGDDRVPDGVGAYRYTPSRSQQIRPASHETLEALPASSVMTGDVDQAPREEAPV